MSKPLFAEDFSAAREVQARVEPIYNLFGEQAPPPVVLAGEGPSSYRIRALGGLKHYSPTWRDVNLDALPSTALDVAERQIFADAQQEALKPTATSLPKDGSIVSRITRDAVGRPHKAFYSLDNGACWNRFKLPTRFVKRWGDEKTGQKCF